MNLENKTLKEVDEAFKKAEMYDKILSQQEEVEDQESDQQKKHRRTVYSWLQKSSLAVMVSYLLIVIIQSYLGGFERQIIADTLAFITQPLSRIMYVGLAIGALIFFLWTLFPILAVFINEKVNTASLKDTFLAADEKSKLDFLAKIILALSLLIGLTFNSAKAQSCITATAQKEVGVLKLQGQNNKSPRIDHYRTVVRQKVIKNASDPWCGYFVGYCLRTCNVDMATVAFLGRARDYFKTNIVYSKNFQYGVFKPKIQEGDLVGYMFNSGNIGHIGIIKEWNFSEGYFLAYEGNTSNLNSVTRDSNTRDGVRLKRRKISTAHKVARYKEPKRPLSYAKWPF
jgi:hypothetical protein